MIYSRDLRRNFDVGEFIAAESRPSYRREALVPVDGGNLIILE